MVNDARPTCKMKVAAPFTNTRATPRLTFCASFTALPYNPGAQPMAGPVPAPLPLDDTQPHFPIPRPFDVSTAVRQGRPAQCQRFARRRRFRSPKPQFLFANTSFFVCQWRFFRHPQLSWRVLRLWQRNPGWFWPFGNRAISLPQVTGLPLFISHSQKPETRHEIPTEAKTSHWQSKTALVATE